MIQNKGQHSSFDKMHWDSSGKRKRELQLWVVGFKSDDEKEEECYTDMREEGSLGRRNKCRRPSSTTGLQNTSL